MKKLLFLIPAYTANGGIKNYFQILENAFSLNIEYMIRGARTWPYRKNIFREAIRSWKDLRCFQRKINRNTYSIVQTSTSLGLYSLLRDGLYLYFARKQGIKTIVFFRGWNLKLEHEIEKRFLWLFRYFFLQNDAIIVLGTQFKKKLISWGYKGNIYLETTIVDDALVKNISRKTITRKYEKAKKIILLFLARVEKQKGIYETIAAYNILKKKNPSIQLIIAGDGRELDKVKAYVNLNQIKEVDFRGYVAGNEKLRAFNDSHIYIFPSYTEGMPNSVLEAMACGLPVVSRPVGGITDVVENGKNGYLTQSKNPQIFANIVERLIESKGEMCAMAAKNHIKAQKKFTTSKVVRRLEKIYLKML